jgi:HK97 family phage major capsid protein
MDTDKMLDLRRALYDRLGRIVELEGISQKRSLSRRELAEVTQIKREAEQLRAQLPPEFNPRAAMPGKRDGDGVAGDTLTPDQRVSDWQRQHGELRASNHYDHHGPLSLGKMVRGAVTGNWKDAEAEQRALVEGTLANGGYLLGPELAGNVIDRVRNQMQVMRAGATTVPMTTEQLYLARLAGGASPAWKSEGAAIADSSPTFERIVFNAKTLPVLVKISAELFEDMSPAASELIEREISLSLSLELDRACLRGSGVDPEPEGILNQSGVTITSLGANGATPSWDNLIDGVASVQANNIEPNAILWASRTGQTFAKFKDSQGRYLDPPSSLSDVQRLVTNQLPTNLTVGSANNCSEIYIGRWSDVLLGLRTDLRFQVKVLQERYIDNLQYGLLMWVRADVQLAHPQAFNVLTGVKP